MATTDFAKCLSKYFHEFLTHQKGGSVNTVKAYRDTFKLLLQFFQDSQGVAPENVTLDHIFPDSICDFLKWLEEKRKCCVSSRNQRLASIHSFFRFLQLEVPDRMLQAQQILAIPRRKGKTSSVRYLSVEEVGELISSPDKSTEGGRRDAVLLTMLYDTAARVQELADISVRDLRLTHPAHVTLTGKGNKARVVPLMDMTVSMTEQYIHQGKLNLPERQDWPLFRNRRGERLTRFGIGYILRKYVKSPKRIGHSSDDRISPHTLRHSKAMHLLEAGNNSVVIQAILGHADIKSTSIYAKANLKMMREALNKTLIKKPENEAFSWREDPDLLKWLKNL